MPYLWFGDNPKIISMTFISAQKKFLELIEQLYQADLF